VLLISSLADPFPSNQNLILKYEIYFNFLKQILIFGLSLVFVWLS
jgi:hypothetical protein